MAELGHRWKYGGIKTVTYMDLYLSRKRETLFNFFIGEVIISYSLV